MFANRNRASLIQYAFRWTARALSIVSTAVLLMFIFGERFEVTRIARREWLGLALFPVGVVVGFAVGWWKEGFGGSITVFSLLAFYLVYGSLLRGSVIQGWAILAFASPGVLFLVSSLLARTWRTSAQAEAGTMNRSSSATNHESF